jgi:hypothetical protein
MRTGARSSRAAALRVMKEEGRQAGGAQELANALVLRPEQKKVMRGCRASEPEQSALASCKLLAEHPGHS